MELDPWPGRHELSPWPLHWHPWPSWVEASGRVTRPVRAHPRMRRPTWTHLRRLLGHQVLLSLRVHVWGLLRLRRLRRLLRGPRLVLLQLVVHHLQPPCRCTVHVRGLLGLLVRWDRRDRLLERHALRRVWPGGTPDGCAPGRRRLEAAAKHVGQRRLGLLVGAVGQHGVGVRLAGLLLHELRRLLLLLLLLLLWSRRLTHTAHGNWILWTMDNWPWTSHGVVGVHGLLLLLLLAESLQVLKLLGRPRHLRQSGMGLSRPGWAHLRVCLGADWHPHRPVRSRSPLRRGSHHLVGGTVWHPHHLWRGASHLVEGLLRLLRLLLHHLLRLLRPGTSLLHIHLLHLLLALLLLHLDLLQEHVSLRRIHGLQHFPLLVRQGDGLLTHNSLLLLLLLLLLLWIW